MEELMFSAWAAGAAGMRGAEVADASPEGAAQPERTSVNNSAAMTLRIASSPFPPPDDSGAPESGPSAPGGLSLVQMYHIRRQNATKIFHKIHDFSRSFLACSYSIWNAMEKARPIWWERAPSALISQTRQYDGGCGRRSSGTVISSTGRSPIRRKRKIHADGVASGFQRSL